MSGGTKPPGLPKYRLAGLSIIIFCYWSCGQILAPLVFDSRSCGRETEAWSGSVARGDTDDMNEV